MNRLNQPTPAQLREQAEAVLASMEAGVRNAIGDERFYRNLAKPGAQEAREETIVALMKLLSKDPGATHLLHIKADGDTFSARPEIISSDGERITCNPIKLVKEEP